MNNITRGIFSSIGLIYIFILPVYIPIRALGIELHSYEKVLISSLDLILYFTQITMLLACNSILLSMIFEFLNKKLFDNEFLILSWYRVIAVVYACIFIATSYFVLSPQSICQLYGWSGAHYFIISFFQLLIRSEINHSKSNNLPVVQANNYFGLVLNISGVISLAIFSWIYSSGYAEYYSTYCICLELFFFIYLLVIRKYYVSFGYIVHEYPNKNIITYLSMSVVALILASGLSILFMLSGCIGAILILAFIGYLFSRLSNDVDRGDLHLIVNVGLGYGLLLAALTASVLAYFVKSYSNNMDLFNYAYSSEPFFSIIIGFVFTWFLLKKNIEFSTNGLSNSIFLLNCSVPAILGVFWFAYVMNTYLLQMLFLVFGAYAYLEYLSLFYVRQIAQRDGYKEFHGAKLTNFNAIVLNGLSPALLYLLIYTLSKLTELEINQLLITAITTLTLLSITLNFGQKYLMKYENK
ncbi:hypothetical protein ELY21_02355 [Legionella sp. km535]|uniref:hypothetical protein n=1 Tax=Legionella sp. km535 TaxID=2498107 RepID=UPI000F8D9325|nr:hypothetical protein [Legionella sp. km535]RUR19920.1 hypothetical protein ELY21_02355 [Legionella sp. km535]